MIPKQLQNKDFKFCIIPKYSKISNTNHNKINFSYDDPNLQYALKNRNNYGVLCGFGNLLVIDFDDDNIYTLIQPYLIETLTTLSAIKRKPHKYYITSEPKPTLRGKGIDLQGIGSYVLGAGSIIKDNGILKKYEISQDIPIAFLTDDNYNKIVSLVKGNKSLPTPTKTKWDNSYYLDKADFLNKPTDFIVQDVIRYTKKSRYEIKISTPDQKYKDKTLDYRQEEFYKILKAILPSTTITTQAIEYFDENRQQFHKKWYVVNVKK